MRPELIGALLTFLGIDTSSQGLMLNAPGEGLYAFIDRALKLDPGLREGMEIPDFTGLLDPKQRQDLRLHLIPFVDRLELLEKRLVESYEAKENLQSSGVAWFFADTFEMTLDQSKKLLGHFSEELADSRPPEGGIDFGPLATNKMVLVDRIVHDEHNAKIEAAIHRTADILHRAGIDLPVKGDSVDFRKFLTERSANREHPFIHHYKTETGEDREIQMWVETDGLLVLISPEFAGLDHGGRNRWTAYASDMELARHEAGELRDMAKERHRHG
jgi:hypothetical protein